MGSVMNWTAIVPMKRHSARVPGKNLRSFCGKPLFHWVFDALFATPGIGDVVLDTDADEIAEAVLRAFPVVVSMRPPVLQGDFIPTNALIAHVLSNRPGDTRFLQTHVTNPLLTTGTLEGAMRMFDEGAQADSLFAVTRIQTRLYDHEGRALNHDPHRLVRTQDLAPVYEENSNLYLFTRESFSRTGSRIGERPHLFEVSKLDALDIDEEDDFLLAESMMRLRLSSLQRARVA